MRRRDLLQWAGFPLLTPSAIAQTPRARLATLTADLEKRIPTLLVEAKTPGASVVLLVDGRIEWRRGFGVRSVESKQTVDNNTVFEAASMSKPVFAYAVLQLVDKGVLQLDTPLTQYSPDRFLAGDPRVDLITARHVLSHTTGFPNWRSSSDPLKIAFPPGEKYGYSGEGYFYLQSVVTHLTGHRNAAVCRGGYEGDLEVCATDIAAYLHKKVLAPLGMRSSGYEPIGPLQKRKAHPHDESGKLMKRGPGHPTDPARYAAAGGLLTTPTDYAKFLVAVVNPASAGARRLSPKSLEQMLKPHVTVTSTPEYTVFWALGWRFVRAKEGEWIGHGGDNPGFHCLAEMSPAKRTGFVIMTNGDGGVKFLQELAPAISTALFPS